MPIHPPEEIITRDLKEFERRKKILEKTPNKTEDQYIEIEDIKAQMVSLIENITVIQ